MSDAIKKIIINRGPAGAAGGPGGAGPAGPTGPRGGTGGAGPGRLGSVLFGGSQDARNHYELDASLQISGGVGTIQTAAGPLVHDLARVSIGQSNPQNAIENVRATGRLTRVGSQTYTMALPGFANGNGTTKVRFLDHYASASYVRHMNDALGNAIEVKANMAQGGERTSDALLRYQEVALHAPNNVLGSWNLGNDIDGGANVPLSLQRIDTMLTWFTDVQGYLAGMYGPPATPGLIAATSTQGRQLMDGVVRRRMKNPNFIWHDTYGWTVIPGLGYGDVLLFEKEGGIHWNQDSCWNLGNELAALYFEKCGALPDSLVQSVWDDVGADALSGQIAPGFWTAAGAIDASTMNGRASGSILPGFSSLQISGQANVLYSIEDEPDGFGKMQRMVLSGVAGSQYSFDYIGPANVMASRLQFDKIYDAGHTIGLTLSAPGVLGDWEAYVGGNLVYASGAVNARLASWMRVPTYENPARRKDLPYGPAYYPYFLSPVTALSANIVRFTQTYTLAQTGSVTIDFGRPTIRRRDTI